MIKITAKQKQILTFLKRYIRKNGYPPTRNEITNEFGFASVNATTDHLKALEKKKFIRIRSGVARGIQIR